MKPVVAIVGRPNVGKSTLFNKIVREKAAIVKDVPGVTRDRLYRETEWLNQEFILIDTGGLEPRTTDFIQSKVKDQAEVAMHEADVILFVVDGRAGVTLLDEEVAYILRKQGKHVIVVVNKVDDFAKHQDMIYEFYSLGFDAMIPVSAEHKKNIGDLLDVVLEKIESMEFPEEAEGLKIAIVGRPNVGKSSLTNKLLNKERTIVSDIAGTTRDAIDTAFEYEDGKYVLIDTAGIRRKSKVSESLEYYSVLRAMKAIKRADISFILLDAQEGITDQDKRIIGMAHKEQKPLMVVVNKWDLVKKDSYTLKSFEEELRTHIKFISYAPIFFISALTGKRVLKLIEKAKYIHEEYNKHISTGLLNEVLREAMILNPPTTRKGRALKLKYMTQANTTPPKFILFVNDSEIMHFSYLRYLENKLRDAFGFEGCPLEFILKGKND